MLLRDHARARSGLQLLGEPGGDLRKCNQQPDADDLQDHELEHAGIDGRQRPVLDHLLEIIGGHGDRRRQERGLQHDRHQRAEPDHVDLQGCHDRVEDRQEHQDDRGPLERPAQQEDQDQDHDQHQHRRHLQRQQRLRDPVGGAEPREHGAENVRCHRQQQHHARGRDGCVQGALQAGKRELAVPDRQDQRAQRADAGGLGRGGEAGEDRAERRGDQEEQGNGAHHHLAQYDRQRMHALLERYRRPELRIEERAHHQIGDVDAGQQEPGPERGGVKVRDRDAEHRSHHDQHHRGRNQNAERAARGDGAGGEPAVVAGLDHDRRGHDAEHRHCGADDAGRHREHGRGQDDDQIERAADRREQETEGREQPLHQSGLLGDEAHEYEQRHRGEQLFLHQPDDLEIGEVEDRAAHAEIAEHQREEQQREGDRHADEDRPQQHQEHDQADERLGRHISTFSLCSSSRPVRAM